MKVESLGGESGGLNSINQKAKDIQKEAEYLLEKVKNGTEQLHSEYIMLLSLIKSFYYMGYVRYPF